MTYKESVDWLFEQFPAYQKIGVSAYKPDLGNVLALCDYFEVNYNSLKYIHVAGTNGKGSTSNYLASVLQESNYKTGLFTSPHILDFRERIRVNGEMISEEKVISFCEKIQASNFAVKPSFFEITWVLALIHFIESKCEICVIETGLGGRLDATNIIHPILSIITNISLDHIAILGNTVEEIAFEKAGIIKKHVPVVIGESDSITKTIFEAKATEKESELYFAERFQVEKGLFPTESYLFKNERTVKQAFEVLQKHGFHFTEEQINSGIRNVSQNTGFLGRYQLVSVKPKIIIDAAHNVAGITQLMQNIKLESFEKLHIIYGASNDKNVNEIIDLFPKDCELYLCLFFNQRSLSFEQLEKLKIENERNFGVFTSIIDAFTFVQRTVNENDILLITGSFFLLSDFFEHFSKKDLLK
ncbi:MAG: folylpolyglutamate synthase/dihydrofolate synthase family protein [Bacteroidota bacterium]